MPLIFGHRALSSTIAVIYLIVYLYLIGDIDIGNTGWRVLTASSDPLRMFTLRSPFHFEAIALAELGWITMLLSPLNLLLAAGLSVLLALNIHGYLALKSTSCNVSSRGSGASALIALLSGGACCAPGILLLLGIPSLGALAGFFGWLLPLSILLLAANRGWQRCRGAPGWWN